MDDKKRTGRGAKENIAIPTGELSRPLHAMSTRDAFQSFPMLPRPRNSNNPGGTDDLIFPAKAFRLARLASAQIMLERLINVGVMS